MFGASGEQVVRHAALVLEHGVNAVLNGAPADQAVHEYVPVLPDAVGPVRGLVFYSGVPPAVHMDDVGCLGQRQAGAGGFQGQDAEGRAGFLLEGGDDVLAFRNRRSPVQGKPGTAEDSGQEIVQTYCSAKDGKSAKAGSVIAGLLSAAYAIVPAIIGLVAYVCIDGYADGPKKTALADATIRFAPAVIAGETPNIPATPTSPTPMVAAVVHELPMDSATTPQITAAAT